MTEYHPWHADMTRARAATGCCKFDSEKKFLEQRTRREQDISKKNIRKHKNDRYCTGKFANTVRTL